MAIRDLFEPLAQIVEAEKRVAARAPARRGFRQSPKVSLPPAKRIRQKIQAISPAFDTLKRAKMAGELLQLFRTKCATPMSNSLQFEGLDCFAPDERHLTVVLVLQDILRDHRELSLIQWPGGAALCWTKDVDALRAARGAEALDINEAANFIVRGSTDKSAALMAPETAPVKVVGDAVDPAAARLNDQASKTLAAQLQ